jgi:hypothetical protein
MAMVVLLQAYTGTSDAEAVQQSVVDLRWQMVLDVLGGTTPAFSQGALHDFRHRLIAHDLDRRLLERTAELARETKGFDAKKLPKSLRVAADSKPLQGAGRVEDTLNLLGHAARDVVRCVALLTDADPDDVARQAGIPLLLETSTKVALDTDWTDPKRKARALQKLLAQLGKLLAYVQEQLPEQVGHAPLREPLEALQQILDQDLEPDPDDPKGKRMRIRRGVAKDRRISVGVTARGLLVFVLLAGCASDTTCGEGTDPVVVSGLSGVLEPSGQLAIEVLAEVPETCEVVDRLWLVLDETDDTVAVVDAPDGLSLDRSFVRPVAGDPTALTLLGRDLTVRFLEEDLVDRLWLVLDETDDTVAVVDAPDGLSLDRSFVRPVAGDPTALTLLGRDLTVRFLEEPGAVVVVFAAVEELARVRCTATVSGLTCRP